MEAQQPLDDAINKALSVITAVIHDDHDAIPLILEVPATEDSYVVRALAIMYVEHFRRSCGDNGVDPKEAWRLLLERRAVRTPLA